MKLTEMQVKDFIELLASDAPAPGGGSPHLQARWALDWARWLPD